MRSAQKSIEFFVEYSLLHTGNFSVILILYTSCMQDGVRYNGYRE